MKLYCIKLFPFEIQKVSEWHGNSVYQFHSEVNSIVRDQDSFKTALNPIFHICINQGICAIDPTIHKCLSFCHVISY